MIWKALLIKETQQMPMRKNLRKPKTYQKEELEYI